MKSAAPVLASQIERMKGNVCQESMQKFCKALSEALPGRPHAAHRAHLTAPHPHLTASRCSYLRGFCIFALFTSFGMFSSHLKIRVKRTGIWLTRGAPVAIRRRMGPMFSMSFCVFSQKTENVKNTEKLRFSKYLMVYCYWGASWELPGALFPDP